MNLITMKSILFAVTIFFVQGSLHAAEQPRKNNPLKIAAALAAVVLTGISGKEVVTDPVHAGKSFGSCFVACGCSLPVPTVIGAHVGSKLSANNEAVVFSTMAVGSVTGSLGTWIGLAKVDVYNVTTGSVNNPGSCVVGCLAGGTTAGYIAFNRLLSE